MGSVGALILTHTFSSAGTVGCQTKRRRPIPWTGYSSLHRLKTLPIDLLKIDRSFVRDVATDPDSTTLTTAMIGLARNLRLEVVAEDVKTEEQMAFLRARGCDLPQGFLLSRPLPADDLTELLKKERPRTGAR
jgi:EAL domain-containing protein (putative c-di-GMP-specific phosphodiesterase class I)